MNKILYNLMLIFSFIFLLQPSSALAQLEEAIEESSVPEPGMVEQLMQTEQGKLFLAIGTLLIVLVILMIALTVLMFQTANLILSKKPIAQSEEQLSFYERFKQKWIVGRMKPVEEEGDMLLDHNYDGIQEMDYKMPPWLRYIFIGTFLFALFYVPAFMYLDIIPDQETEYQAEIQAAALLAEKRAMAGFSAITAETAELSTDEAVLEAGRAIFDKSCAVCHAKDAGGGVGPNLTDEYWIHDGDLKGVFTTISEGVPQKGMIPWKGQLAPKEIQDVANYVLSLAGTTPELPKEPQGEIWKQRNAEELIDEAVEENLPEEFDQ